MGAGWMVSYLFAVATAGGALAVLLLALRWAAKTGFLVGVPGLAHLSDPKLGIPYGIAIAAGGLFVLPTTDLFALATGAA